MRFSKRIQLRTTSPASGMNSLDSYNRPRRACVLGKNYQHSSQSQSEEEKNINKRQHILSPRPNSSMSKRKKHSFDLPTMPLDSVPSNNSSKRKKLSFDSPTMPLDSVPSNNSSKSYRFRSLNKVNYFEGSHITSCNNSSRHQLKDEPKVPIRYRLRSRAPQIDVSSGSESSDRQTSNPSPTGSLPTPEKSSLLRHNRAKRNKKSFKSDSDCESKQVSSSARNNDRKLTLPRRIRFIDDESEDNDVNNKEEPEEQEEIVSTGRYPKRKRNVSYKRYFDSLSRSIGSSKIDGDKVKQKYNLRVRSKDTLEKLRYYSSFTWDVDPEPLTDDDTSSRRKRPKVKANGAEEEEDEDDTEDSSPLLPINYHAIKDTRPHIEPPKVLPAGSNLPEISYEEIGGLKDQIQVIKEAVLLPNLYPELCQSFNIKPARGILFYGPPGTGKTMMAQALISECSKKSNPMAFFHINASDILSKWVGKSEAKIQNMFRVARTWQPSVLFIDEIDGLTPPRSSTDRHNASLVASLLSQMDGLESLGQVLIIGATNRLHAIDPALRRPGRFEEELYFPLPDLPSRTSILKIATCKWGLPPTSEMIDNIGSLTHGYSGANLKALCAKAGKIAFLKSCASKNDLDKDRLNISVTLDDFTQAMSTITHASHSSNGGLALGPLPPHYEAKYADRVSNTLHQIQGSAPSAAESYSLPTILLFSGEDTVLTYYLASSVLYKLDKYQLTPITLGDLSTSDDASDLKAINLILKGAFQRGKPGCLLVQNIDVILPTLSSELVGRIKAALQEPYPFSGERMFLLTVKELTDDVINLLNGLTVLSFNA